MSTQFPNGTTPLTVKTIYATATRKASPTTRSRSRPSSEHYTTQLDSYVFVKLASGVSPAEGARRSTACSRRTRTPSSRTGPSSRTPQAAQINQLLGLIYVMLLLAVVIALIGIANTLALSIYERTRELGLLRAVGMSRASCARASGGSR